MSFIHFPTNFHFQLNKNKHRNITEGQHAASKRHLKAHKTVNSYGEEMSTRSYDRVGMYWLAS